MYFSTSLLAALSKNSSNETTVMIRIPASQVENVDWVKIEVIANDIFDGENVGFLGIEGTKLGFGLIATGIQDLVQNTAPSIIVLDGPSGGENYSENLSIKIQIVDDEGDGYVVVIRLNNTNYSIDLSDCAISFVVSQVFTCEISISED